MFEIETAGLYVESCNCGDQVRHNNGGNYHRVVKAHIVTSNELACVVIEKTDTREAFPRDEYEALMPRSVVYLTDDVRLTLCPVEQLGNSQLGESVAQFRRGEAEIVWQECFARVA